MRPWSPIRQWLRALAAFVELYDEAIRFAASVDSDPRLVNLTGGPTKITIRIRPTRESAGREFAERAA